MIDITNKKETKRLAIASAAIYAGKNTIAKVKTGRLVKGDALITAKTAAILAVKKTQNLIPMCHPVKTNFIGINYKFNNDSIQIYCCVRGSDKTGFEMEALTGVSICALTIYDMAKSIDNKMVISDIRLIKKSGGKRDFSLKNNDLLTTIL
ncbi:MAG: cyclic pyranopterin monophosphate synthase MoaC [Candidatus Omnitrophota bacterium]